MRSTRFPFGCVMCSGKKDTNVSNNCNKETKKINAWLKAATTFLVQLIVEEMYSVIAKITAQKAEKPPLFLLFTRHLTLTFYLPCHRLSLEHLL